MVMSDVLVPLGLHSHHLAFGQLPSQAFPFLLGTRRSPAALSGVFSVHSLPTHVSRHSSLPAMPW